MADGAAAREVKDLYAVGEIPPDFHVPKNMHAWAIRRERQGRPKQAMQLEVVPTPEIASDEVLVLVMAAGVNYNGIWAGLGEPVSMFDVHKQAYHVAGSDASGIVWAVGDRVKRWKPGDEVVIHCNQDDGDDEECNGGDPMFSPTQRIWGYETPDGSFGQFCRVQSRQLRIHRLQLFPLRKRHPLQPLPRPRHRDQHQHHGQRRQREMLRHHPQFRPAHQLREDPLQRPVKHRHGRQQRRRHRLRPRRAPGRTTHRIRPTRR